MGEKKPLTCQNPSCKTTFTSPLKALNLQESPVNPYYACPFCLTKVDEVPPPVGEQPTDKLSERAGKLESLTKKRPIKSEGDPSSCGFHLGYLSERAQKTEIPDGCLVCKSIVECMLKRMQQEQ